WQSLEVAFVHHAQVGVEARKAQRSARAIDESGHPAEAHLRDPLERPLIDHQGGRGSEGNHVRQRIVFRAEWTLSASESRDTAVETVEYHGDKDGERRKAKFAIHRLYDGIETGGQCYCCDGIRQPVNALAADASAH